MPRKPRVLPEHESAVRRLVADAEGEQYVALTSLAEARAHPDAFVVFEGDYGGQIYAVVPIALVACSEAALHELLHELDAHEWSDPEGARVYFERYEQSAVVPGGMGGGNAGPVLWVHPRLKAHQARIAAALARQSS